MFASQLLLIVLTTFAGILVNLWIIPTNASPDADNIAGYVGGGNGGGKSSSYYLRDMSVSAAANSSGRKF